MSGIRAVRMIFVLMLLAMALGLGGCRRIDTSGTGTTNTVTLPVVGSDASPLPTPGTGSSPLQR
jgi:hypothetical protein